MNKLEILIFFELNFNESNIVQACRCSRFLFCAVILLKLAAILFVL
jgi:hypothetical protein